MSKLQITIVSLTLSALVMSFLYVPFQLHNPDRVVYNWHWDPPTYPCDPDSIEASINKVIQEEQAKGNPDFNNVPVACKKARPIIGKRSRHSVVQFLILIAGVCLYYMINPVYIRITRRRNM